ncbi:hypothetical protein GCM10023115_13280 [Pontixanthobacter gangjinensis]
MEPGGWCDFVRKAAVESYPYAMLSSNAYQDEDTYAELPLAFLKREAADNDNSGLAYSVFDRHAVSGGKRGKLLARVIAFRGTEFGSTSDIFSGSLGDSQRDRAGAVYAAERANLDAENYQDVPIELTGHSLGGAIATQLSVDNPGVKAFVFNTSPFFNGDPTANDIDRLAISERGEFLRVLRRYKAPPAADMFILNCSPNASAGEKHSIRTLADCLTWIAAYDSPAAFDLLAPNAIRKPEVECGDDVKIHPGAQQRITAPCVHLPMAMAKDK